MLLTALKDFLDLITQLLFIPFFSTYILSLYVYYEVKAYITDS